MSGQNEPSQISGNIKSVQGQVVEQIGNLTGSTEWQQSGKQTHAEGEAEQKAAQAKAYAEGAADRVGGYKDSVVGAVTGDKAQQSELQRGRVAKWLKLTHPTYSRWQRPKRSWQGTAEGQRAPVNSFPNFISTSSSPTGLPQPSPLLYSCTMLTTTSATM